MDRLVRIWLPVFKNESPSLNLGMSFQTQEKLLKN
jgi:hypothetical protein